MKTDDERRVLLTTRGTLEDLAKNQIQLRDGLVLSVYTDDADDNGNPDCLVGEGVVQYDDAASRWVLRLDWNSLKHESDFRKE